MCLHLQPKVYQAFDCMFLEVQGTECFNVYRLMLTLDCSVIENQKLLSNVAFDNLYRPILYDFGQFLASLLNFMENPKLLKIRQGAFDINSFIQSGEMKEQNMEQQIFTQIT